MATSFDPKLWSTSGLEICKETKSVGCKYNPFNSKIHLKYSVFTNEWCSFKS